MSGIFNGRRAHIGIHLEDDNAFGAAATPEFWLKRMDTSFTDAINATLQNESDAGSNWQYNSTEVVGHHGEGDIGGKLWYRDLYYLLCLAFGQRPVHTETTDGAHQYDFSINNENDHLMATIFVDEPNRKKAYPHALLNTLSIEWAPDAYPTFTMNMISQKSVDANGIAAAFEDDKDFLPDMVKLKLADTVDALEDANSISATSAKLELTKNASAEPSTAVPDDYDPATFGVGNLGATVNFEKYYADDSFRQMMIQNAKKAVQFGFVDTVNKAGTSTPISLIFTAPKYGTISRTDSIFGLGDKATESIEGPINFDLSSGKALSATLIVPYEYTTP